MPETIVISAVLVFVAVPVSRLALAVLVEAVGSCRNPSDPEDDLSDFD